MKALRWMSVSLLALGAVACGEDGGGGSTAGWCDLARDMEAQFNDMGDAFGSTPESLEKLFGDMKQNIDDAVDAAPSEIRDAVEQTADAVGDMQKELADVDFNILDVDQAAFETIGAEAEAASDEITEFNEKECGIVAEDTVANGSEETGDTLGGTGTGREQIASMLEQMGLTAQEATCVSENLDPALAAQAGTDPSVLFDVFETCDVSLERLAEIGANSGG